MFYYITAGGILVCPYNFPTADCIDGQVRLAEGGLTDMQGRLEVCFSGRWGTVSDDGWTHTNAEIVCNELGYDLSGRNNAGTSNFSHWQHVE